MFQEKMKEVDVGRLYRQRANRNSYQVYDLERREKDARLKALLWFAIEALKAKYKPGYGYSFLEKKRKKKKITLVVEDFS